jgi:hypothetical protein
LVVVVCHSSPADGRENGGEAAAVRGGAGASNLPELPSFWLWPKILIRFGEEADRNAADFAKFSTTVGSLVGSSLFGQAQTMIQQGKDDSGVIKELHTHLGLDVPGCNTLQIGVVSGLKVGLGGGGVTGVAIPLHEGSKVKWFSGYEVSAGLTGQWEAAALMIGMRTAFPHELSGMFYGAYAGVHLGPGLGLTVYFSPDDHLEFEGFSFSVGVGFGGGLAVLAGRDIVTSD